MSQCVLEYEIPPDAVVPSNIVNVAIDTMGGASEKLTYNEAVQTYQLTPATPTNSNGFPAPMPYPIHRKLAQFSFNGSIVCKLIRVRPVESNIQFKMWKYSFPDFIKFPADATTFTDWSDNGWPCEKTLRSLEVEANTNGQPATVHVWGDGKIIYSTT